MGDYFGDDERPQLDQTKVLLHVRWRFENNKKNEIYKAHIQGDSGGPLMISQRIEDGKDDDYLTQIGIVSFGYGCAKKQYPGVYAR